MKLNVLAILHRGPRIVRARRYSTINTAMRRAVDIAIQTGEPGDVVEFSRVDIGAQIGTVKLHTNNRLTCEWTREARILDWTPRLAVAK